MIREIWLRLDLMKQEDEFFRNALTLTLFPPTNFPKACMHFLKMNDQIKSLDAFGEEVRRKVNVLAFNLTFNTKDEFLSNVLQLAFDRLTKITRVKSSQ